MHRGFTLLELLITVAVLSILLVAAAPSFKNAVEINKMQRLANELHGFFIQAKSTAVLRRERLWAHLIMPSSSSSDGNWRIELTDNQTENKGNILFSFSGAPFKGISVIPGYSSNQVSFDDIHGRPTSGNIRFHPVDSPSNELKLVSYKMSARVRVCRAEKSIESLGYSICSEK